MSILSEIGTKIGTELKALDSKINNLPVDNLSYDEGYFDTTVTGPTSAFTYNNRRLRYVKIGNLVNVVGRLYLVNVSGGVSFEFTLPFTNGSTTEYETSSEMQNIRFNDAYTFRISADSNKAVLQNDGSSVAIGEDAPHINVSLTYITQI